MVVPRRALEAQTAQLGALAGSLAGVDLLDAEGRTLGVNLLPPSLRLQQRNPWRLWNIALGVAGVLALAFALARLASAPTMPTPIGVFRDIERPTYEVEVQRQVVAAVERQGPGDLASLIASGATWEVE